MKNFDTYSLFYCIKDQPRGKESTKVRKSQIKGKEIEEFTKGDTRKISDINYPLSIPIFQILYLNHY